MKIRQAQDWRVSELTAYTGEARISGDNEHLFSQWSATREATNPKQPKKTLNIVFFFKREGQCLNYKPFDES